MLNDDYYAELSQQFSLTQAGPMPIRRAQLGALHALGAHFAVHENPAILALPTGVGKTAVAAASPFVIPSTKRVLYVVPTRVLRQDAVANLRTQRQLKAIALLPESSPSPTVIEVDRRPESWSDLNNCNAAVSLPNALFELIEDDPPPRDLFDLIVFDEAHHVPARTWALIADAFDARKVLLTATPYRRDARELPGHVVFNYPLSQSIRDGSYAPIELVGVEAIGMTPEQSDSEIATRAIELLHNEHAGTSSRLLVRASTKKRVEKLAEVYKELGANIHVVHSSLSPATVEARIADVRSGDVDGVAFVGVLGEGFDCPELKIGAYHDKHKSLPVTLQFLGRLSRICAEAGPPQVVASIETIRGDTWSLWRRDSDWSAIIPELAETATEDVARKKDLLSGMDEFPRGEVSLADIVLLPSFGLYEIKAATDFDSSELEDGLDFGINLEDLTVAGLTTGNSFAGGSIVWSHLNESEQFLLFVTSHVERPDWLRSKALDTERFEMHIVLVRKGSDGQPVVVVSSSTRKQEGVIMALLSGGPENYRLASPDLMRRFLNVAEIGNIQHLGMRNSAGNGQARTYTTNSGKAVEDGMAYEDLRDDVVGHVGAQCHIDGDDYGGVSIGNSRIWVIKRFPIDGYIDFISDVLKQMGAGQPGEIRRLSARFEHALAGWPVDTEPIAVALDPYFFTDVGSINNDVQPTDLDLAALSSSDGLVLEAKKIGWQGTLRVNGTFSSIKSDVEVATTTGTTSLEQLLIEYPPTVFYRNGTTTRGQRMVPPGPTIARPPLGEILYTTWDWTDTNIRHEIPREGRTDSIHEKVVEELKTRYPNAWIIGDDGSGEIADHIVVDQVDSDQLTIHLVHSKASTKASPGLRTKDLDELVAQIVRSKRWIGLADQQFWERLASRVRQRNSTELLAGPGEGTLEEFSDSCRTWSDRPPLVTIRYIGVQPGLDTGELLKSVASDPAVHPRLTETIGACAAWVGDAYSSLTIVGSP